MQSIFKPKLTELLPDSLLADENIKVLAQILDSELELLSTLTKKVIHLPRLKELQGEILNLLLNQLHVESLEPLWLDEETKRTLIADSIKVHRLKGTPAALELVNKAFGRQTRIVEWFQDSSMVPFSFKIFTEPFESEIEQQAWIQRINDAKNVRSWLALVIESSDLIEMLDVFSGNIIFQRGTIEIPSADIQNQPDLFVGSLISCNGTIEILASDVPNLFVGNILEVKGRIELESQGEKLPAGDSITLTFDFPNASRQLTLHNLREGVTQEDIDILSDFIAVNNLLLVGEETALGIGEIQIINKS